MRTRLDPEKRRLALLEQGTRWFQQGDYSERSIAQFAKEAGISTGLLYHYFKNKQVFWLACQQHVLDALTQTLSPVDAMQAASFETLRMGIESYAQCAMDAGTAYLHFVAHPTLGTATSQARIDALRQHTCTWALTQTGHPSTQPTTLAVSAWHGALTQACVWSVRAAHAPSASSLALYLQNALVSQLSLAPSLLEFPAAT